MITNGTYKMITMADFEPIDTKIESTSNDIKNEYDEE